MHIQDQNAQNIYNVGGDLKLENSPETIALLEQAKQERLNESNAISYFNILNNYYSKKLLIEREDKIIDIRNKLEGTDQLLLYGEPGLGKTTSSFQLAKETGNVIYISAKDRSPISILVYLINKIRIVNKEDLLELNNVTDAFHWLEVSLQKSNQLFIIDDCEQNIELINKIITVEKFDSKFLFLSRNKEDFESTGISTHQCLAFDEDETKLFLEKNNVNLGKLEYLDVYNSSCGNPLYLFYFSQYQISPLPENLISFQDAIWAKLTSDQQEVFIYISIPYFDLTVQELSDVFNLDSPLSLITKVDKLSSFIKNNNGELVFFHPSFKEFILEKLKNKGLFNTYAEKLGRFFLERNDLIQATYLLIDVKPDIIDDYLLDIFPSFINWGELDFALKILNTKILTAKDNDEKGCINYYLCNVYNLLGLKDKSFVCINKSVSFLELTKNRGMLASALMFQSMSLIEKGEIEKSLLIADDVVNNINDYDKDFKPVVLVNLSKIYVDLSEFKKGATVCKEAFEIFKKENNRDGMINSLVNLTTCLSKIPEFRNEAEKYGLELLDLIDENTDISIEIIVLNTLSSINREKKDYPKAKKYSNLAIKLCQKYNMKAKVVLNLINYGNILRDDGEIDKAIKIYEESLMKAQEHKLKREIGRVYWILSSIYRDRDELQLSIEYSEKSITVNKEINFYYGIANALSEKADTLKLIGDIYKTAETLVESAKFYQKIDHFHTSYQHNISRAVKLFNSIGEKNKANKLINELLKSTSRNIDSGELINLILQDSTDDTITTNFKKIFIQYLTIPNNDLNIFEELLLFINHCNNIDKGSSLFIEVIKIITSHLGISKFSYSLLALAIEQSGELLVHDELISIAHLLQEKLPLFSIRQINEDNIYVSSINGRINMEYHVFKDENICNKLVIALILILHEIPELIIDEKPFLESNCVIWINTYSGRYKEIIGKHIQSKDEHDIFEENVHSLHQEKKRYDIQEVIIIDPNYENKSSLIQFPENKSSLYFFSMAIMGIKSHFYHSKVKDISGQRKFIFNTLAELFNYTNFKVDQKTYISEFDINMKGLNPLEE